MNKIWLTLVLSMVWLPVSVLSQAVPKDIDSASIQVVTQEHKNTRKFFSDELTRQRNEFYKQMDDRATYYENTANDMIANAVWKLGLMWGGVVLFIFGVSNFLGRRLEKRKWSKMLEGAKAEIMADVNQQKTKIDEQHKVKEQQIAQASRSIAQQKAEIDERQKALSNAKPQLVAMQQKIAQQQKELQGVMKNLQMFGET